ncbi:MAG TPA: hypothetical protein VND96_17120 [Candidatus Micrarchaeaceae archaeon]|nr:hypothetical protein [Candidatus Micrarchaeaceae archaeon]
MAGNADTAAVLREAKVTHETAKLGLEDFLHGQTPGRRIAGLRNVVVWGRAVTNVLQNIKTFDRERFEAWYAPRQTAMREKTDFKYLVDLRSQVLKEGVLGGISSSLHIEEFNTSQLRDLPPAPPGAGGFFIGDHLGGSGWIVKLADGTEERYYVELPTHWKMTMKTYFTDVTTQLGLPPPSIPIDQLLTEYVAYLGDLIKSAQKEFA